MARRSRVTHSGLVIRLILDGRCSSHENEGWKASFGSVNRVYSLATLSFVLVSVCKLRKCDSYHLMALCIY